MQPGAGIDAGLHAARVLGALHEEARDHNARGGGVSYAFPGPGGLRNIRSATPGGRGVRRHIARDYNHARANGRPKRRRANGSFAPGRKSPTAPTTAFANCASSPLVNSRRGWNCKGSANALQRLFIPLRERYRTRTVLKMVKCLTHYIKLFGAIRNNGAHGLSVSRTPLQKGAPRPHHF